MAGLRGANHVLVQTNQRLLVARGVSSATRSVLHMSSIDQILSPLQADNERNKEHAQLILLSVCFYLRSSLGYLIRTFGQNNVHKTLVFVLRRNDRLVRVSNLVELIFEMFLRFAFFRAQLGDCEQKSGKKLIAYVV